MNCSFGPKREAPFEIPRWASEVVDCDLVVQGPGDFSAQLTVYVGDDQLSEIVLTVRGTSQAGDGPAKAGVAARNPQ